MTEDGRNEQGMGRGQVGIGTLVVFLGLVLTAALAGGVVVSTADNLQTRAQSAAQDSSGQVSTNLVFHKTTATVADGGEGIEELMMKVQLGPGSNAVDLGNATITVSTNTGLFARSDGESHQGVDIVGGPILSTDHEEEDSTVMIELQFDDGSNGIQVDDGAVDISDDLRLLIVTGEGSKEEIEVGSSEPLDPRYDGGETIRLD